MRGTTGSCGDWQRRSRTRSPRSRGRRKYAVDAVLAAVAGREAAQGATVTVFTSDTEDMNRLHAGRFVRIENA
ncbi:hypothetical protein [Streptomyces sp. NPDC002553]|uniref:hypothetical protein n=1 Tax=Streptomyces sp. NPDC002553 TaxID=3154417 RepID=UPI003319102C